MTADGVVIDEQTRTVTITRTYPAAPERVWFAWTDADALARWWGPHGWTTTVHHLDVRPGGEWRFTMTPDDGSAEPVHVRATYRAVEPHRRLGYVDALTDGAWQPLREFTPTDVTFERDGDGTRVVIATTFPDAAALRETLAMGMAEGYREALDRLAADLRKEHP